MRNLVPMFCYTFKRIDPKVGRLSNSVQRLENCIQFQRVSLSRNWSKIHGDRRNIIYEMNTFVDLKNDDFKIKETFFP